MVDLYNPAFCLTKSYFQNSPGRVAQSVTCLATDACLTADPGVVSLFRSGTILSWRLIMK